MRLYKLTDQSGQTRNQTQWGENVTHKTNGKGEMCGPGWLHAYTSPLLAVLFNPIHADIPKPQLWEAEGEVMKSDGCKVGTTKLTTIKQIPLPKISTGQRVKFAILCALEVYKAPEFATWANRWLNGVDRTREAASAAARAAASAASAASWGAAMTAWEAAEAAAWAAVAAWAEAAEEATEAAWRAAVANRDLRLEDIADKAVA